MLSGAKRPFSIVLPPPNVTGNLHVGHALDHTLMDILARWHRMSGDEVLWLPGMDHAGIATQNVVERQLAVDGKTRHDFGRELFVQKVWDWKAESGGAILGQMKRLGDSVDWDRERFTLDEGLSSAVQTIFKQLFDDGLIYRAKRIINWCPGCHTALSDIEVEHSEDAGELVSIRYGSLDDPSQSVVVATTRVETMLGDTAVAVHPDDERYRHLVGRTVLLPIIDREIPVVADTHVDPRFGTGAVKVTPAHDPNDFEIGLRHGLDAPTILDERAHITGTGTRFDGMDRLEARAAVKEELRAQGRIVAEKIPYLHSVGHCSRSDDVIEPRLSTQWFVKVAPLAKAAGDAVREGRTVIHPQELGARYFDWVDNMHDWTISRQLWWGHRIPVWYGPDGETRCVGPDEEPPGEGWTQDPDVLDTWFSSGLWPFSTMGWPKETDTLRAFYPTSVLVTGYDILFFWVVRMMMFGLYATRDEHGAPQIPFRTVALHGLVRDQYGKKMSKSKGNTVDPLQWIEDYGADAVRFTLARGSNPGADQAIATEWVAGSGRFCSKLFNATNFVLSKGAVVPTEPLDEAALTQADRWILDRLDEVIVQTTELLERLPVRQSGGGAVPLRVGRALRLVPGTRQGADPGDRRRPVADRDHPAGAGNGAGQPVPAAAPVRAVRHRDAVDLTDRRGEPGHRRLAGALRSAAGRRRGRLGRRRDHRDQRDPPGARRPEDPADQARPVPAIRDGRPSRARRTAVRRPVLTRLTEPGDGYSATIDIPVEPFGTGVVTDRARHQRRGGHRRRDRPGWARISPRRRRRSRTRPRSWAISNSSRRPSRRP